MPAAGVPLEQKQEAKHFIVYPENKRDWPLNLAIWSKLQNSPGSMIMLLKILTRTDGHHIFRLALIIHFRHAKVSGRI